MLYYLQSNQSDLKNTQRDNPICISVELIKSPRKKQFEKNRVTPYNNMTTETNITAA